MNNPLNEAVDYLVDKVSKINLNNPRANRGCHILRGIPNYEDEITHIMDYTVATLVSNMARSEGGIPEGIARLTTVITLVGCHVYQKYFGIHSPSFQEQCHGGSQFIEAMIDTGLVRVIPAEGYDDNDNKKPYVIVPTDKWEDIIGCEDNINVVLRYTQTDKPTDINNLMQPLGYPVIKNWHQNTKEPESVFNDNFIDSIFVRSVDKLQQTPWKINQRVFDVVKHNTKQLVDPKEPLYEFAISKKKLNDAYKALKKSETEANKRKYNEIAKEWEKTLGPLKVRAKRIEAAFTLAKARKLSTLDKFYQLVDLDYRGRCYYKEPYMNYQGNDIARGLLTFAQAKELNDEGKMALAVHTANSYNQKYNIEDLPEWLEEDYKSNMEANQIDTISVDKFSLNDRIEWFNQNIDLIMDTAEQGILHDCEKPVVFLACCFEWEQIEIAEDRGEIPMTSIPVAIDGTCNGYQHSAALSKDEKTGSLVALQDSAIPNDLYVKVAQRLVQISPEFFKDRDMSYAEIRKLISKRATMTRAYSAGAEKIADSMYKDCAKEGADDKYNITLFDCDKLAVDIIKAIEEECPGSQKVMKFLQDLASWVLGETENQDKEGNRVTAYRMKKYREAVKDANKAYRDDSTEDNLIALNEAQIKVREVQSVLVNGYGAKDVRWISPSGFPVIYAPKLTREESCLVTIKGVEGGQKKAPGRINLVGKIYSDAPNKKKVSAGIAPNMIHSLDAAHMSIVIDAFEEDFGCVHDSFSCHASDVARLKKITQESFVHMYDQENPLEYIKRTLTGSFDIECNIETPELGTLDVTEVLESKYFFS